MELANVIAERGKADSAPLIAYLLSQACRTYEAVEHTYSEEPLSDEDAREGLEILRRITHRWVVLLSFANRVIDAPGDSPVDLEGRPFPPPGAVVRAIRDLQDNYGLLLGVVRREDVLVQPLVPWKEICSRLEQPEARNWMKTALAAF